MKKPLVVNMFGGPCTGKSTTAANIFSELKWRGVNCELVPEYAKDKVWERSFHVLENQIYVFAKQLHRIWRVKDQVDIVITDSPLLFSIIYDNNDNETFRTLVLEEFKKLNTLNFVIERNKPYYNIGRVHTEEESKQIDQEIIDLLENNGIQYNPIKGGPDGVEHIVDTIMVTVYGGGYENQFTKWK